MFGRQFDYEGAPNAPRSPFFSHRLFGRNVNGACDWSRAHSQSGDAMDRSKWSLAPHPIEDEKNKRKLEPTPEWREQAMKKRKDLLSKTGSDVVKSVLEEMDAQQLLERIGDEVNEEYIHDFRNWALGIGKRSDYVKAGVPLTAVGQGQPLSRHKSVIDFADKITGRVIDYYEEIAKMKMRGPSAGKKGQATLDELWRYFKYVVRNEPIDPADFDGYSQPADSDKNPRNTGSGALVGNRHGIRDDKRDAPSLLDASKSIYPENGEEQRKRAQAPDSQYRRLNRRKLLTPKEQEDELKRIEEEIKKDEEERKKADEEDRKREEEEKKKREEREKQAKKDADEKRRKEESAKRAAERAAKKAAAAAAPAPISAPPTPPPAVVTKPAAVPPPLPDTTMRDLDFSNKKSRAALNKTVEDSKAKLDAIEKGIQAGAKVNDPNDPRFLLDPKTGKPLSKTGLSVIRPPETMPALNALNRSKFLAESRFGYLESLGTSELAYRGAKYEQEIAKNKSALETLRSAATGKVSELEGKMNALRSEAITEITKQREHNEALRKEAIDRITALTQGGEATATQLKQASEEANRLREREQQLIVQNEQERIKAKADYDAMTAYAQQAAVEAEDMRARLEATKNFAFTTVEERNRTIVAQQEEYNRLQQAANAALSQAQAHAAHVEQVAQKKLEEFGNGVQAILASHLQAQAARFAEEKQARRSNRLAAKQRESHAAQGPDVAMSDRGAHPAAAGGSSGPLPGLSQEEQNYVNTRKTAKSIKETIKRYWSQITADPSSAHVSGDARASNHVAEDMVKYFHKLPEKRHAITKAALSEMGIQPNRWAEVEERILQNFSYADVDIEAQNDGEAAGDERVHDRATIAMQALGEGVSQVAQTKSDFSPAEIDSIKDQIAGQLEDMELLSNGRVLSPETAQKISDGVFNAYFLGARKPGGIDETSLKQLRKDIKRILRRDIVHQGLHPGGGGFTGAVPGTVEDRAWLQPAVAIK